MTAKYNGYDAGGLDATPPPVEYPADTMSKEQYQAAVLRGDIQPAAGVAPAAPAPVITASDYNLPLPAGMQAVEVKGCTALNCGCNGKGGLHVLTVATGRLDAIYPLLTLDELAALPPPRWLYKPYLLQDTIAVIYGAGGAGKSFWTIDISARVALAAKNVLYIAAEGQSGLSRRIQAWEKYNGVPIPRDRFRVFAGAADLMFEPDCTRLASTAAMLGNGADLIVFDTLSRATIGLDENSTQQTGVLMDNVKRIRDAITAGRGDGGGPCLLLVHHSNKQGEMRGNLVIRNNSETMLAVSKSKDGVITLHVDKQKDVQQAGDVAYTLETVELPAPPVEADDDTEPFSCVLVPTTVEAARAGISPELEETLQAFNTVEVEGGQLWASNTALRAAMGMNAATDRQRMNKRLTTLKSKGFIKHDEAGGVYQLTDAGRRYLSWHE